MQKRRIELFIAGVLGLLTAYFMPELASFLVGFEGLKASPGLPTEVTNLMMFAARLCCAIYAVSLIFSGLKRRTII